MIKTCCGLLLMLLLQSVWANCGKIVIWTDSNFPVKFYTGNDFKSKFLIGSYQPRVLNRKFRRSGLCLNDEFVYAKASDGTVYRSLKRYTNLQSQFIFLEFPKQFTEKPGSVGDGLRDALHLLGSI